MTFQTSYGTTAPVGRAGMLADFSEPHNRDGYAAETSIGVGLAVLRGTAGKQAKNVATVALDVDSILATGGATSGSIQTLTGATLDGVIGVGRIVPAQQVTMTLSSHADWNLTTAQVRGEDADGNVIVEEVIIPDAGNVTVTTIQAFGKVTAVYLPAQASTGGTFTIGTAPTKAEYSRRDVLGIAEWQSSRAPYDVTTYSKDGEYAVNDDVPVIGHGRVWVKTEAAALRSGAVYVRIVTSGADTVGQFSSAPSASFALVRGAKFHTAQATAAGLVQVQL